MLDELTPGTSQDTSNPPDNTPEPSPDAIEQDAPATTEAPATGNTVADALKAFEDHASGRHLQTPAAPTRPVVQPRNFDGLEEDEKPLFKRMSNEAYERIYPKWLEYKKLTPEYQKLQQQVQELQGKSFFDEPNAYMLTPDYVQALQGDQQIANELAHWQEQLANIEAGNEWIPIVLDNQGRPVLGAPQPPDTRAKVDVMTAISQAHSLRNQYQQRMGQIQADFGGKHKSYVEGLKAARSKIFAGADMTALERAGKTKLEMFPSHVRGRPETQIICELLALVDGLNMLLNKSKASTAANDIRAKTAKSAGPTSDSLAPGTTKGTGSVGDALDAFKKARAMGMA